MYWKRFAASVTAWRSKYRDDSFFRAEVHAFGLQALFVLLIIAIVIDGTAIITHDIAHAVATHVDSPNESMPVFQAIEAARIIRVHEILTTIMIVGLIFGYITSRLVLIPVRGALAAQKQFIGNIAHELRTPLSIIKMNCEVALLEPGIPAEMKDMVVNNVEELDRISEIINNLLSLSALVNPGKMDFGAINISALISDVAEKFLVLAARSNIEITVRKNGENLVWGNTIALRQILSNLIKNSITYTPGGGSVTITASPAIDNRVEVTVRDTGAGIASKDLSRIFEPFYRADPSRTHVQAGSGLGLTIVSELVRLHHGKISVKSTVGSGTEVSVLFPAARKNIKNEIEKTSEISVDYSDRPF